MRFPTALLPLVVLLASACASGGGARSQASFVQQDLGQFTAGDIAAKVPDFLLRNQFTMFLQEGPPAILQETAWRPRAPFADEAARGVAQAEVRVIVRGRLRSTTGSVASLQLYSTQMLVETRVRRAGGDWEEIPATDEFRTWARALIRQLQVELETLRTG